MSYAPFYLVTPRQRNMRDATQSRDLQAQTRAVAKTLDRPTVWLRAWRFIADRPIA